MPAMRMVINSCKSLSHSILHGTYLSNSLVLKICGKPSTVNPMDNLKFAASQRYLLVKVSFGQSSLILLKIISYIATIVSTRFTIVVGEGCASHRFEDRSLFVNPDPFSLCISNITDKKCTELLKWYYKTRVAVRSKVYSPLDGEGESERVLNM